MRNNSIIPGRSVVLLITFLYCVTCYAQTGTVKDIDGNVYKTVKIGKQEWMMENLKVTHYRNGDEIPNVMSDTVWSKLTTGAYCNYNNINKYNDFRHTVNTYGRLYNWYAVHDSRNIAPQGWHVPTDSEWTILVNYIGGQAAGARLKETGSVHWSQNMGATNESGFTALPGGRRIRKNGEFECLSSHGYWWSFTEESALQAYSLDMCSIFDIIYKFYNRKGDGLSVRCLKD
jgi:uncharacterized protein (TIGR02145 family)